MKKLFIRNVRRNLDVDLSILPLANFNRSFLNFIYDGCTNDAIKINWDEK